MKWTRHVANTFHFVGFGTRRSVSPSCRSDLAGMGGTLPANQLWRVALEILVRSTQRYPPQLVRINRAASVSRPTDSGNSLSVPQTERWSEEIWGETWITEQWKHTKLHKYYITFTKISKRSCPPKKLKETKTKKKDRENILRHSQPYNF